MIKQAYQKQKESKAEFEDQPRFDFRVIFSSQN